MRIVIISHTEHYISEDGKVSGWGSTIRELDHVAEICDELIHLAPLYNVPPPDSSLSYTSQKITHIALKPSGGQGLQKLNIVRTAYHNLKQIHKFTKTADFIQFRAPTGIGIYVLPYLKLFRSGRYWVKYAGNWMDQEMPFGNRLQKYWLKNMDTSVKVTINGNWEDDQRFLPFENPCLTEKEYFQGQDIISKKVENKPNKYKLIFVGSLNRHKGVHLIIDALKELEDLSSYAELILVGDGEERGEFEVMAQTIDFPIHFLGHCSKNKVAELLSESHVLLLPSKSEGFPKVVGEAMNYGCIPIVTNISCMNEYIENGVNGLLMSDVSSDSLRDALIVLSGWKETTYKAALKINADYAARFTYSHYNSALRSQIFDEE